MFRHTKIQYDPSLDYEKICKAVYGENQCLCVAEKLETNAHVHFQGLTNLGKERYDDLFAEYTQNHFIRRVKPGARPVRHVRSGNVDEVGFQYMCKESPPNVLYKNGFTEQDIEDMHQASEEHVEEVKSGMKRKLHEMEFTGTPEYVHEEMQVAALKYFISENKFTPPNFQKQVLYAMATKPGVTDAEFRYVAKRI